MFADYNIKKYILNHLNLDRILISVIMNYVFRKNCLLNCKHRLGTFPAGMFLFLSRKVSPITIEY